MKFFLDNIPMGDVPGPTRQPGEFFPRLVGLRVSIDGNRGTVVPGGTGVPSTPWADIEPLYIPLVRVHRRAGQVMVEINSNRPLLYITLQVRRPFINVFRFEWERLETE